MRYYNSTKDYDMPVISDEPNIIDDNTEDERKITIECVRFHTFGNYLKNRNDNLIVRHRDSYTKKLNDWYKCSIDELVCNLTTFKNVVAIRQTSMSLEPMIVSGSYDYDGETERFEIPLLSPIYSNDNIKCSKSNKTSNKNLLTINPQQGIIEVSRKV